jgi:hypothetical protein
MRHSCFILKKGRKKERKKNLKEKKGKMQG